MLFGLPTQEQESDAVNNFLSSLGFKFESASTYVSDVAAGESAITWKFFHPLIHAHCYVRQGNNTEKNPDTSLEIFLYDGKFNKTDRVFHLCRTEKSFKSHVQDYIEKHHVYEKGLSSTQNQDESEPDKIINKSKYLIFFFDDKTATVYARYRNQNAGLDTNEVSLFTKEIHIRSFVLNHFPNSVFATLSDPHYSEILKAFTAFNESGRLNVDQVFAPTNRKSRAISQMISAEKYLDRVSEFIRDLSNEPEIITEDFVNKKMNGAEGKANENKINAPRSFSGASELEELREIKSINKNIIPRNL